MYDVGEENIMVNSYQNLILHPTFDLSENSQ